jgi:hypothetical protein
MRRLTVVRLAALLGSCDIYGSERNLLEIAWPQLQEAVDDSTMIAVAISYGPESVQPQDGALYTYDSTAGAFVRGPSMAPRREGKILTFDVTLPADNAYAFGVRVGAAYTAGTAFPRVFAPRPAIAGVTPDSARLGTGQPITVSGTGFADDTSLALLLNGVPLPIGAVTPTSVTFTLPVDTALHTGLLAVRHDGRVSQQLVGFRVIGDLPRSGPRLMHVTPATGRRSEPLRVVGVGFDLSATILVNGARADQPFRFATAQVPGVGAVVMLYGMTPAHAPLGPGAVQIRAGPVYSNPYRFVRR